MWPRWHFDNRYGWRGRWDGEPFMSWNEGFFPNFAFRWGGWFKGPTFIYVALAPGLRWAYNK